jgi:hypothetical protein
MIRKLSELGEFGLIERIRKTITTDSSVIKGIGDDCAVIRYDRRTFMLLTQDMLVERVDFTRRDDPRLILPPAPAFRAMPWFRWVFPALPQFRI